MSENTLEDQDRAERGVGWRLAITAGAAVATVENVRLYDRRKHLTMDLS